MSQAVQTSLRLRSFWYGLLPLPSARYSLTGEPECLTLISGARAFARSVGREASRLLIAFV